MGRFGLVASKMVAVSTIFLLQLAQADRLEQPQYLSAAVCLIGTRAEGQGEEEEEAAAAVSPLEENADSTFLNESPS